MLGRLVTPVVDIIDVDGIIQRIDVNELVERVDWDKFLDSVDIDRVIQRIDINKLLQKVDVTELVDRAEIPAIVARSTSGVFSPLIDSCRSQVVIVDQAVQGVGWIRKQGVPQAPGLVGEVTPTLPTGGANIAVVVQERYAGTLSRALAFFIDTFVTSLLFFLVISFVEWVIEIITKESFDIVMEWSWGVLLLYWLWVCIYMASALISSSRTLGKVIMGLKVVNNEDGSPVKAKRAIVRTLFLYLNIWSIVGVVLGLIRRDRREFHDLIAGTGVVYSWDARMARYRQEQVEGNQMLYTGSIQNAENKRGSLRRRLVFRRKREPEVESKTDEENQVQTAEE